MLASFGLFTVLSSSLLLLLDHFRYRYATDSAIFAFLAIFFMILLLDVNNQIRLLELLQRHQLPTPSPDTPTI
jgi:hypothetical protein